MGGSFGAVELPGADCCGKKGAKLPVLFFGSKGAKVGGAKLPEVLFVGSKVGGAKLPEVYFLESKGGGAKIPEVPIVGTKGGGAELPEVGGGELSELGGCGGGASEAVR